MKSELQVRLPFSSPLLLFAKHPITVVELRHINLFLQLGAKNKRALSQGGGAVTRLTADQLYPSSNLGPGFPLSPGCCRWPIRDYCRVHVVSARVPAVSHVFETLLIFSE